MLNPSFPPTLGGGGVGTACNARTLYRWLVNPTVGIESARALGDNGYDAAECESQLREATDEENNKPTTMRRQPSGPHLI